VIDLWLDRLRRDSDPLGRDEIQVPIGRISLSLQPQQVRVAQIVVRLASDNLNLASVVDVQPMA